MVNRSERGHAPLGLIFLALLLLAALILCLTCAHPHAPPPTPAPRFIDPDSTTRSTFLAYAESLEYDSNLGAGDEQRLMVGTTCPPWAGGGNCTYGPLARIEPQIGTHRIPDSSALASGRVIARVITVDSQYPKLGLRAGQVTYWWVDRRGPSNGWRSVLVSSDSTVALVHNDSLELHPVYSEGHTYSWRQALARFYWSETDEKLWSTCMNGYCCKMK